jgi:hypothetical protein
MSRICKTQNKILEAITQIHDIKRIITNIQDISQDQENLTNTEPSNDQLQDKFDISEAIKTHFPTHNNTSHSSNNIPEPRTLQDDPENIEIEHSYEEEVTPHNQSISGKHKSNMPDLELSSEDNSSRHHKLLPNHPDKLSAPKHEEERIDEGIGDIEPTKSSLEEISEIPK